MTKTDMPDEIYIPKDMKWRVYFQPHELKSVYQDEKEMTSYIRADLAPAVAAPTPSQKDALDELREKFENWLTGNGNYPHLKHKHFGGNYLNEEAAMKWDGFKEGYKSALQEENINILAEFILTKNDYLRAKAHEIARKVIK